MTDASPVPRHAAAGGGGWRLLPLTEVPDARGLLVVAEVGRELPFLVRRMFYLRDVPDGQIRGVHAHRTVSELLLVMTGRVDVLVDDGRSRSRIVLDDRAHPSQGVYLPPLTWVEVGPFAPGAVCLVLADGTYDPGGAIADYEQFKSAVSNRP
jgi:dTDP-4-dehydrorhamnose 3,5-epimerase-like enzyme